MFTNYKHPWTFLPIFELKITNNDLFCANRHEQHNGPVAVAAKRKFHDHHIFIEDNLLYIRRAGFTWAIYNLGETLSKIERVYKEGNIKEITGTYFETVERIG